MGIPIEIKKKRLRSGDRVTIPPREDECKLTQEAKETRVVDFNDDHIIAEGILYSGLISWEEVVLPLTSEFFLFRDIDRMGHPAIQESALVLSHPIQEFRLVEHEDLYEFTRWLAMNLDLDLVPEEYSKERSEASAASTLIEGTYTTKYGKDGFKISSDSGLVSLYDKNGIHIIDAGSMFSHFRSMWDAASGIFRSKNQ